MRVYELTTQLMVCVQSIEARINARAWELHMAGEDATRAMVRARWEFENARGVQVAELARLRRLYVVPQERPN